MDVRTLDAVEPDKWIVIFNPVSDSRFVRWFCIGRFKHVAAFAYVPDIKAWITYDVGFFGTRITVVPKGQEMQFFDWIDGCTLVTMTKRNNAAKMPPIFGWCVPSVRRLLGLRGNTLRPDALYRQCLRQGGTILSDTGILESAPAAARAAG